MSARAEKTRKGRADPVRHVRGSDSKSPLKGCQCSGTQSRMSIGVRGLALRVRQHGNRTHILGPQVDWTFRDKGHTFSMSRENAEVSLSKC